MNRLSPKLQSVYDCIKDSSSPLGAYALLENLRTEGFKAPTQIYRALNQLIELGLIHKIESLNAFVACAQDHQSGTSILAICDNCGSVEELPSAEIADQVSKYGSQHDFVSRELAIEMKGLCSDCD